VFRMEAYSRPPQGAFGRLLLLGGRRAGHVVLGENRGYGVFRVEGWAALFVGRTV